MIVAVHQPNFFPWLGYFDKLVRSDCFIVLDDVQFPKKGGTWMNRVQIARDGRPHWLTAPVDRGYSGVRLISEMRFAPERSWRDEVWRAIELAYSRAPCWSEAADLLKPLVFHESQSLVDYNVHGTRSLLKALGIAGRVLRLASEFGIVESGTAR
ncbi:MAG: wbmP, partial [Proteobacteria bacterium]|nr:wbmP [Pseudomonadota bacterium]